MPKKWVHECHRWRTGLSYDRWGTNGGALAIACCHVLAEQRADGVKLETWAWRRTGLSYDRWGANGGAALAIASVLVPSVSEGVPLVAPLWVEGALDHCDEWWLEDEHLRSRGMQQMQR